MFWFKACRKCRGDLYQGDDPYGAFVACMQCGNYLTRDEEAQLMGSAPGLDHHSTPLYRVETLAA